MEPAEGFGEGLLERAFEVKSFKALEMVKIFLPYWRHFNSLNLAPA